MYIGITFDLLFKIIDNLEQHLGQSRHLNFYFILLQFKYLIKIWIKHQTIGDIGKK